MVLHSADLVYLREELLQIHVQLASVYIYHVYCCHDMRRYHFGDRYILIWLFFSVFSFYLVRFWQHHSTVFYDYLQTHVSVDSSQFILFSGFPSL